MKSPLKCGLSASMALVNSGMVVALMTYFSFLGRLSRDWNSSWVVTFTFMYIGVWGFVALEVDRSIGLMVSVPRGSLTGWSLKSW